MELTPIDVQQKTFRASLRGYAEEEVDDFLDQIVETLHTYEQKLQDAQERVAALEEELAATRETEEAIKRTFIAAQRTRDEMIEEARAETERLLAEAREEAEQQLVESRLRAARAEEDHLRERDELLRELTHLRGMVGDLRARFQALASGALEDLEGMESTISDSDLADLEPREAEPARRRSEEENEAAEVVDEEETDREPSEEEEEREVASDEAEDEEEPEESRERSMAGQAAYLRRPRSRRPWERDS